MQKPEPWPGNAWCVPPAVLQARPRSSASSAVSSVPANSRADSCQKQRSLELMESEILDSFQSFSALTDAKKI